MTKYAGAMAVARANGISYWAIVGRMRDHEITAEEAVAMGPVRKRKPTALQEAAARSGIDPVTLRSRLNSGKSLAEAVAMGPSRQWTRRNLPQEPRDDVDDVADETGLKRAYVMLRIRKMLARGVKTREEALRMIRERIKAPPGPGQCAACYSKAHDLDGCTTLRAAWLRVHPEEIPR